jgi:Mn2+/Fe2+ NRAMP family transporter
MTIETPIKKRPVLLGAVWRRLLIFVSVFGPATITAMADNDAGGVATYSVAGATLGYPILFPLVLITILLGMTQEMGMRLTIITGKGLADLIREKFGVKVSLFIFGALLLANMGTIVTELSAIKVTSAMLGIPGIPAVFVIILISFLFITRGNYKLTQSIMLVSSLFFVAYIISAFKARPDWGLALSNLAYPHGVNVTSQYLKDYMIIGMGVLGTTITPWGQFFISSFAFDKKIEKGKVNYSQLEAYWGAFLTDFFSFFMIVATAATLFVNGIPLISGEAAALAIKPFAIGILNAGFMGLVIVSLSTAYAFAEFFGISGSLDNSYKQSKTFYTIFIGQLLVAALFILIPNVPFFKLAVTTQVINAMSLPLVFYFLIKLTSDKKLMGDFANNRFQRTFAIVATVVIMTATVFTLVAAFVKF